MDPAVAMTVLKVLGAVAAALAMLWGFVAWDEKRARAQFRTDEFETRVASLWVAFMKGEDFETIIGRIVGRASTGLVEPINTALADQRRSSRDQGERIGKLETWAAVTEHLIQKIPEHETKLASQERVMQKVVLILQRHKLTDVDPEEPGGPAR